MLARNILCYSACEKISDILTLEKVLFYRQCRKLNVKRNSFSILIFLSLIYSPCYLPCFILSKKKHRDKFTKAFHLISWNFPRRL